MILALVLGAAAAVTVFALTIGVWKNSMAVTAALMALAFIAGALLMADGGLAMPIYAGLAFAFVVYFCYMLTQLIATLKQIAMALQARK
jgi:hypothetical protein